MQRRQFLKISSILLSSASLWSCLNSEKKYKFAIEVLSDRSSGHLLFTDSKTYPVKNLKTQTLIVGGGIAGMSSAYHFKDKDFLLCEVSDFLGGTSSSKTYQNTTFCQGAHYEVYYPDYFGKDTLAFLEKLNIIYFDKIRNTWEFIDKQFLIPSEREESCLIEEEFYDDILLENQNSRDFINKIEKFVGQMKLPTTEIHKDYHYLNKTSFLDYLQNNNFKLDNNLIRAINYRMLDDFGGTAKQVSALAGVYYYTARPFGRKDSHIFSPPQGNFYFIEKMLLDIPISKLLTKHLVKKIIPRKKGFIVDVLDIKNKIIKKIKTKQVIFAANKHTLKYIFPQDHALFKNNEYAPWLVLNIILKDKNSLSQGYWQNEMLDENDIPKDDFLGFIDSDSQSNYQDKRVLTAYYCLSSLQRKDLIQIEDKPESITHLTLTKLAYYFDVELKDLEANIEKVFIKIMGHAMPIPKPNYLLSQANSKRQYPNLVYAGVDSGRLPLFFEAIDSGREASQLLIKSYSA